MSKRNTLKYDKIFLYRKNDVPFDPFFKYALKNSENVTVSFQHFLAIQLLIHKDNLRLILKIYLPLRKAISKNESILQQIYFRDRCSCIHFLSNLTLGRTDFDQQISQDFFSEKAALILTKPWDIFFTYFFSHWTIKLTSFLSWNYICL